MKTQNFCFNIHISIDSYIVALGIPATIAGTLASMGPPSKGMSGLFDPLGPLHHYKAAKATKINAGKASKPQGSQSSLNAPYPGIQAILQPPNEFTLIAGRMNSGSKYKRAFFPATLWCER